MRRAHTIQAWAGSNQESAYECLHGRQIRHQKIARAETKFTAIHFPSFLFVFDNPDIKSLKDIKPEHKIATPAAIISVQARTLQIAAEKEFGVGNHNRLDKNVATLPHSDATAALLSGSTEVVAHISNSPFQVQALKDPKIRKIWSSYDVVGDPLTPTHVYTTLKFREVNPKTYKAFVDAFDEATAWIDANKKDAAETFIRVTKSKLDPKFILAGLSANPGAVMICCREQRC